MKDVPELNVCPSPRHYILQCQPQGNVAYIVTLDLLFGGSHTGFVIRSANWQPRRVVPQGECGLACSPLRLSGLVA